MRRSWPFDPDGIEPTVVIAVGVVLVLLPEVATSTVGVALMLFGIAWWFQE